MKLRRLTARLALGAILTLPAWAHAAGLGKLTLKSALGQPLSAEIELLVADKAELDSLNASLASGQAYKDAHIEFAPVLSTLQFSIEKRADGQAVLKLTSTRPVNDPFMDMLIELNWASGRLLREYTVLLDPPSIAVPQTIAPVAISVPEAAPAQARPVARPAEPAPAVVAPPKATPATAQAEKPVTPAPARPTPPVGEVRVERGDTLGQIAEHVRPASVSLEQALVGLFRENPAAFQSGNMNRLKAGSRLKLPSAESMAAVDPQSARREVNLQAADWQAYRARLAERVAEQPVREKEAPAKAVVGKIMPKVEDKSQPSPEAAQDVLKLSKAPPAAAAGPEQKARAEQEDRAARDKALKESAERAASLEKQIQDMQKLAELKEKEAAPAPAVTQKPPAAATPKARKVPPPPVEPEANWYDELLENPIYWTGGLAVVVLGGVLWWMIAGGRKRRKRAAEATTESLITGGELQSSGEAVGIATGGVVNTGDTSFMTDFSQAGLAEIDTHDVDPIAEADVYMAYGRDAQAEEILKEALGKSPERHEIRLKLLEIYAARKNITAFETVAGELYAALGGQTGTIWDKAVEMGRAIDPHNPLYGGSPATAGAALATESAVAPEPEFVPAPPAVPEAVEETQPEPEPEALETAGSVLEFAAELPEIDLGINLPATEPEFKAEEPAAAREEKEPTLDFDLSGFDLKLPEEAAAHQAPAAPAMDFSGLDLDLGEAGAEEAFDEVTTKLDLARAYLEMGDKEGAREILQEVLNEGNDRQKSDAQSILAGL